MNSQAKSVLREQLPRALRMLQRAKSSGVLHIDAAGEDASILLFRGRLLSATAGSLERIGETLAHKGLVHADVVHEILRAQDRMAVPSPLGTLLFEHGLVSRAIAEEEIADHTARALLHLFDGAAGSFRFEPQVVGKSFLLVPAWTAIEERMLRQTMRAAVAAAETPAVEKVPA